VFHSWPDARIEAIIKEADVAGDFNCQIGLIWEWE